MQMLLAVCSVSSAVCVLGSSSQNSDLNFLGAFNLLLDQPL